jgi:2-hydroxychromene-2-carboxylate isomerase
VTTPDIQAFYGISSPWAYFGAQRVKAIADAAGARLVLRPIRIIEANGGIPLRTRPEGRQAYHVVELKRWRSHLGIPLNLAPKFYPCRTIEIAAQAVIAMQNAGLDAFAFSFAVQRGLWAEERDIADLDTLREFARATVGAEGEALVRDPQSPEIVAQWQRQPMWSMTSFSGARIDSILSSAPSSPLPRKQPDEHRNASHLS